MSRRKTCDLEKGTKDRYSERKQKHTSYCSHVRDQLWHFRLLTCGKGQRWLLVFPVISSYSHTHIHNVAGGVSILYVKGRSSLPREDDWLNLNRDGVWTKKTHPDPIWIMNVHCINWTLIICLQVSLSFSLPVHLDVSVREAACPFVYIPVCLSL